VSAFRSPVRRGPPNTRASSASSLPRDGRKGLRRSRAIDQVVELDDLTVVLGKLPALMSRTELELSLHDLDEQRSSIERAQNRPFGFDSSASDGTVKRPPHRSLRQDWKRFLVPIGRYACATFEGPPSSRSRATSWHPVHQACVCVCCPVAPRCDADTSRHRRP